MIFSFQFKWTYLPIPHKSVPPPGFALFGYIIHLVAQDGNPGITLHVSFSFLCILNSVFPLCSLLYLPSLLIVTPVCSSDSHLPWSSPLSLTLRPSTSHTIAVTRGIQKAGIVPLGVTVSLAAPDSGISGFCSSSS